jgi:uncharacterized tellurite resistance protein B-like protein
MNTSIRKLFGLRPTRAIRTSRTETETIRKIVRALDQLEPERARFIAGFAYALARVARADLNISQIETERMEQIVAEEGGLSEGEAILVIDIAKRQTVLFGGTENFLVTQEFGKITAREQKLALLHCLFAVAASDQSVSSVEEHEIRNISRELLLSHQDYIQVRLAYRDQLTMLKRRAE